MLKNFLNGKKKIILIAAVVFVVTAILIVVFLCGNVSKAESAETVTRAEWITMLTDTMGYGKANDAEAYFTDVTAANADYDSIQIAVAYNLLASDLEQFYPDDAATREFVATTTAKAVGFVGTPTASLNDISGLKGADSIRLAVDNKIFNCPDGNFNPGGETSLAECNEIIGKIKDIITIAIDPDHEDVITLNKSVVDLSESTNSITYNDAAAMSVIISGSDAAELETGSVYLLPPSNEYPYGVARKVISIARNENGYVIENEEPRIEEILDAIDVQGEYYPDYSNIIWAEGVTGEFVPDTLLAPTAFSADMPIRTMSIQPLGNLITPMANLDNSLSGSLKFEFEEDDDDSASISGSVDIKLKATLILQANFLAGEVENATLLIEQSQTSVVEFKQEGEKVYPLFQLPIPTKVPGVYIVIKGEINASGEFTMTLTQEITDEFGFAVTNNRMSIIETAPTHTMQAEVEASAQVAFALKPTLKIWGLDVADVGAHVGTAAKASITVPQGCIGMDIYVPLFISASLFPENEKLEKSAQRDIWTEKTSPVRFNRHYEDGKSVEDCTKEGEQSATAVIAEDIYGKFICPVDDITVPEYIPYITFLHDNRCKMLINYLHGTEVLNGTYRIENNKIFVNLSLNGSVFEGSPDFSSQYIFDIVNSDHIVIDRSAPVVAAGSMFTRQQDSVQKNDAASSDSVSFTILEQALLNEIKLPRSAEDVLRLREIISSTEFDRIVQKLDAVTEEEGGYKIYMLDEQPKISVNWGASSGEPPSYFFYFSYEDRNAMGWITLYYYKDGYPEKGDSVASSFNILLRGNGGVIANETYLWYRPQGQIAWSDVLTPLSTNWRARGYNGFDYFLN